jgi:hypothetical protein
VCTPYINKGHISYTFFYVIYFSFCNILTLITTFFNAHIFLAYIQLYILGCIMHDFLLFYVNKTDCGMWIVTYCIVCTIHWEIEASVNVWPWYKELAALPLSRPCSKVMKQLQLTNQMQFLLLKFQIIIL